MNTFDKLLHALQHGDVAVVLTKPRLSALIAMVETAWRSDEDFALLQELKNLQETDKPKHHDLTQVHTSALLDQVQPGQNRRRLDGHHPR